MFQADVRNLEFKEAGGLFYEKIKIDEGNGIVEVDVPDHGKVQGAKYLSDFNVVRNYSNAFYQWRDITANFNHFNLLNITEQKKMILFLP